MKVINFWAGPGAGKSTAAAGLFYKMKMEGRKVELVTEFAKELVYEDNPLLRHNLIILGEQDQRMRRLVDRVDYAITDCPLPIASVYGRPPFNAEWFSEACWALYDTYDNINVLVKRVKPYLKYGRLQDENEARVYDNTIRDLIRFQGLTYREVAGDDMAPDAVLNYINGMELDEQTA